MRKAKLMIMSVKAIDEMIIITNPTPPLPDTSGRGGHLLIVPSVASVRTSPPTPLRLQRGELKGSLRCKSIRVRLSG